MINELLEKRQTLFEIAEVLYGDTWVGEDSFWNSPTEKQLTEVQNQLFDLGWEDDITPEQMDAANKLAKSLGLDLGNEEEGCLGF
jgi:hypothetical protein